MDGHCGGHVLAGFGHPLGRFGQAKLQTPGGCLELKDQILLDGPGRKYSREEVSPAFLARFWRGGIRHLPSLAPQPAGLGPRSGRRERQSSLRAGSLLQIRFTRLPAQPPPVRQYPLDSAARVEATTMDRA